MHSTACPVPVVPWLPEWATADISHSVYKFCFFPNVGRSNLPKLNSEDPDHVPALHWRQKCPAPMLAKGSLAIGCSSTHTTGSLRPRTLPSKFPAWSERAFLERDEERSVWYNYTYTKVIRERADVDRKTLASCPGPQHKSRENAQLGIQRLTQSLIESQSIASTSR